MKIMILTASTGAGHNKAAEAIEEYIQDSGLHEVQKVDTFKVISRSLDKTVCNSYLFMARKAPYVFGKLYKQSNKDNVFSDVVPKLFSSFGKFLLNHIKEKDPDLIITTHPFSTEMISKLKESGEIRASQICVITDYGLHKAWLGDAVDAYVTACSDMTSSMRQEGVPEDRIHSIGIPVRKVFFSETDRAAIINRMGFDSQIPVVLLMAGSFGVANIISLYRILEKSDTEMQIVVITGKNQKLYEAFEKEVFGKEPRKHKIQLVYYTSEVQKYMKAADLLITKPGGLTTSEALACNLPIAAFDAIPGQEEDNARFIEQNGMGLRLHGNDAFEAEITTLLADKERLQRMRENCSRFNKSDCGERLLDLIGELERKMDAPRIQIGKHNQA